MTKDTVGPLNSGEDRAPGMSSFDLTLLRVCLCEPLAFL